MKKIYLYPLWLRIWHILNATLFLVLIATGMSMHFSAETKFVISFHSSVVIHNIAGILLSFNFIFYITLNFLTGNYKHYLVNFKGMFERVFKQAKYYLYDIYHGKPHPYDSNEKNKFNPLQQLGYVSIMFGLLPLIVLSGWALLFPEFAPDEILGMGGVWPIALLHTLVAFFLAIFLFVHLYLGTTGHTLGDLFKTIVTGWHIHYDHHETEKVNPPLPPSFYNPITFIGMLVVGIAGLLTLIVMIAEFAFGVDIIFTNELALMIFPVILLAGISMVIFGAMFFNKKTIKEKDK
jgi:thiosulfate reductase cytochrome b subunit